MFVVETDNKKRHGPFNDADPKSHSVIYDSFYSESAYCATCHDVSNPAFTLNKVTGTYDLNALAAKSETFITSEMFPVERTYSEWTQSTYANGGVSGTSFGGNKATVSTCQDCHMQDVTGYGCNKNGVLLRNDLPMHDMTGGNTFVPLLIKQLYSSDSSVNTAALDAGILRARGMLQNAASLNLSAILEEDHYELKVNVTNETGHKLPSGYPEGRRMWVNLKAYDIGGTLVYESGNYDFNTAVLDHDADIKVYEIKPGPDADIASLTGLPAEPSFHFV